MKLISMRYKQETSQMKTALAKTWQLTIENFKTALRTTQWPKPVEGWCAVNTDGTLHEDGTAG